MYSSLLHGACALELLAPRYSVLWWSERLDLCSAALQVCLVWLVRLCIVLSAHRVCYAVATKANSCYYLVLQLAEFAGS